VLPGTGSDYIRQQKEFLVKLNMPAAFEGEARALRARARPLGARSSACIHRLHGVLCGVYCCSALQR